MKLYTIEKAIELCNTQNLTMDIIMAEQNLPNFYKQIKELNLLHLFDVKIDLSQYYNHNKEQYENKYSFNCGYLVYKQNKVNQDFILSFYKDNGFYFTTYTHYKNLSQYQIDNLKQDLIQIGLYKTFNKVNKPNEQKLFDLFQNELLMYLEKNTLNEKNNNKIQDFRNKILNITKDLDKKDYSFWEYTDKLNKTDFHKGEINKQNIQYNFEIDRNGYITEKIKYIGNNDLETFLSL
jgi:hypothetical protein